MSEKKPQELFIVEAPESMGARQKKQIEDNLGGNDGVDVVAYINERPRTFASPELADMERGDIRGLNGGSDAA